jgi:chromosome segregation ATPase
LEDEKNVLKQRNEIIVKLAATYEVPGLVKPITAQGATQFVRTFGTLKGEVDAEMTELRQTQRARERESNDTINGLKGRQQAVLERLRTLAKDKAKLAAARKEAQSKLTRLSRMSSGETEREVAGLREKIEECEIKIEEMRGNTDRVELKKDEKACKAREYQLKEDIAELQVRERERREE